VGEYFKGVSYASTSRGGIQAQPNFGGFPSIYAHTQSPTDAELPNLT